MRRLPVILSVALGLLIGGLVLLCLVSGLRLFLVNTPSMATAAPVGSLVITQPASSYQQGDIITFQRHHKTYTHRVIASSGQSLTTKGDLNRGADPLPITPDQIIGKAIFIHPWLGWVCLMLPWLIIGWLLVHLLTARARPERRWYYRILGVTLVLCAISLWFHPWVNFGVLHIAPAQRGAAVHIVNTGVFPLNAHDTTLFPGEDTHLTLTDKDSHGRYSFTPTIHFTGWVILVILMLCLIPFLVMLYGVYQLSHTQQADETMLLQRLPASHIIVGAIIAVVGVCLIVFHNFYLTMGAFTGQITNNLNNSRTLLYNCADANKLTSPSGALFIYGMTFFDTGTRERDLSGNSNDGSWLKRSAKDGSQSYACRRDRQRSTFFTDNCLTYPTQLSNPHNFTLSTWFNTTLAGLNNGRIAGFTGTPGDGADSSVDRVVYLDKSGRLAFAVWPNATRIVFSPAGKNYADGQWHHVAVSLSDNGMTLHADGERVAHDRTVTQAENSRGYWKFGCGRFSQWQNADGSILNSSKKFFSGALQFAAVHTTALNDAQIKELYLSGVNR